ncbi:hypothetical protein AEGHOMDF_1561 [Methylobacterium soli]|nr:hypothetical protein AEGHOMDF_1561 [Methylobacterium soli]
MRRADLTDAGAARPAPRAPGPGQGEAPALVIFDCDGVLIDSEPISLARLTAGLNRIGVDIDVETVRARFAGTAMTSIMGHVAADYGICVPDGFVEAVKADTLRAFDRELRAMRGCARSRPRSP